VKIRGTVKVAGRPVFLDIYRPATLMPPASVSLLNDYSFDISILENM